DGMGMAWLRPRPARVPVWMVDAGWAVAVAAAVTLAIRGAREPDARPPDLLAYALGWAIGALLLARRRWPLGVLVLSFVTLQAYYVLDYPGISAAVPLAVALYTAGAAGHLGWGLLIAGWFVAGPILFRIAIDPEPVVAVLGEVVRDASLWLATLLLGALARERRLLEVERARSERLLRDMLPTSIAERLKQGEGVIADAFGEVTVLFADIADFTWHAERSPPEATVALLNDLFSRFDVLTESRGLEKIKTIGDAYMVAGGLPAPTPGHAEAVAELALEMLEVAAGRRLPDGGPVRLRIGIDSGPVVAGVIGRRRFSYDLWGDTANTASRMETTGIPGCIQVTERTRALLDGRYRFQERGRIQVKGKGTMRTYFLSGRKEPP
ncbi:MAG TPA: adenylate/guanylate cyclase domain-containing protein, partial [Actinomycetes bacterium]|nr:adenylate/guanylate cyclase domain-containing protein [Actinomycetes bacterium]